MENGEIGITSTKDLCRVTSMIRQFTEYIGGFIAKTKRYTDIMELTPNLPRLFIRKIMVQEKSTKWSKEAMRAIKIPMASDASAWKFRRARKAPGGKPQRDSCRGYPLSVNAPVRGTSILRGVFSINFFQTNVCFFFHAVLY